MATPKLLNLSNPGGGDVTSPSSSLSRRKSLRKPASKRAASDAVVEEEPKKKKKLASTVMNRIWSEDDELAILKGLVDYRSKKGLDPNTDWDAFFHFIQGSIHVKVSKDQLLSKIRKLRRKFRVNMERLNETKELVITRSSDSEAFGFSMIIWGRNEDQLSNEGMGKAHQRERGEEKLKKDKEVANAETVNENGAAKSKFDGKSLPELVDEIMDNMAFGSESRDDDDADALCAVRDAFETIMSQGLSDYQKKLLLEKLMNLGNEKIKELSNEWRAFCLEQGKLNIKKLRFSAKLAEAANEG